jgi:hypothetical protein
MKNLAIGLLGACVVCSPVSALETKGDELRAVIEDFGIKIIQESFDAPKTVLASAVFKQEGRDHLVKVKFEDGICSIVVYETEKSIVAKVPRCPSD